MCKSTPYHMSHRAHGLAHGLAEGDDLTSELQTLEVTVLRCQALRKLQHPYLALSLLSYILGL